MRHELATHRYTTLSFNWHTLKGKPYPIKYHEGLDVQNFDASYIREEMLLAQEV